MTEAVDPYHWLEDDSPVAIRTGSSIESEASLFLAGYAAV
jgi:hypothetical protein